MKTLVNFEANSEFESAKTELEKFSDYAALSEQEREVHVKEIPNMVDIALWDATDEKILMIRGWEYDTNVYSTDRYTPIGVEVIPRSHMDDGYSRIMSLKYMRYDTPKVGGELQYMVFGLYNQPIEGITYKTFVPCLNESGSYDFGDTQEIKRWVGSNLGFKYFSSDNYVNSRYLPNPFTNNYYYGTLPSVSNNYIPSPYTQNMMKNPIFYTENPTNNQPSLIIEMDGKEKTEKILNQLAVNIGNEDWKNGDTIPNTTSDTLNWTMICPPVQCCWMYSTVGTNQGDWYLPSLGELVYTISRLNAVNNSLNHIKQFVENIAADMTYGELYSTNSYNNINVLTINVLDGNMNPRNRDTESIYSVRAYMKI